MRDLAAAIVGAACCSGLGAAAVSAGELPELRYALEVEVRAAGHRTHRNNLYRVPFPDGTWQHTIGLAPLNATPVAALPLRGGAPMQRGKIY